MLIYRNNKKKDVVFEYNYTSIQLPEIGPHPDFMKTEGEEYSLDEEKILMLLHQVTPTQTSVPALRIGDLLIVGAPGELIAELGLKVKESLQKDGIKYPVIGGLSNQLVSYILSETEYEKGGYEASVSFYEKNLGDAVVKGMIDTAAPLTK